MDILADIRRRAREARQTIILAEPHDDRVLQAADYLLKENIIAELILLGPEDKTRKRAKELSLNIDRAVIVDPATSGLAKKFGDALHERRKHKGMTPEQALTQVRDNLFFGASMVKAGIGDGMVAGSLSPTPKVIQSGIYCIGVAQGLKTISSFFLMVTSLTEFGVDGNLIYADAGFVPDPTSEQLVDIAASSAAHCRMLLQVEPLIAFLSFSTLGSAEHPKVDKVRNAVKMFKERYPDLKGDGEMQLDSAIVPEVAAKKAPGSPVAGKANVLIFPDLDAGNIGYKLTERFSRGSAIGPILQGLEAPINDLSRGCKWEDIVDAVCVTALQAVDRKKVKGASTAGAPRPDIAKLEAECSR
ncbi:MAG: phosphate acetyltransferase [Phycisphaerae bacterium]